MQQPTSFRSALPFVLLFLYLVAVTNGFDYQALLTQDGKNIVERLTATDLENQIVSKVYGVATKGRAADGSIPQISQWPLWIPANSQVYRTVGSSDWTVGFFPGTLWHLYKRSLTRKLLVSSSELMSLARSWQSPLAVNKDRIDTHDLGFMLDDSFGMDARFTGNSASAAIVHDAATSLAKRYSPIVKSIRSWRSISDMNTFTVIIDNMMNLEMLFWSAKQFNNATFSNIAISHAETTQKNHFRPSNYSTYHAVDYSPTTGAIKSKYTVQGFADWSTWSRGQSWAINGFANAYKWTNRSDFLTTAQKAANLYLANLPSDGVPYWDFNAPLPQPRDTSAAAIATSGLLAMVYYDPAGSGPRYLNRALKLLDDTITLSFGRPSTSYSVLNTGKLRIESLGYEGLLMNGTQNGHATPSSSSRNTGIVYAGYYLVEALEWIEKMGLHG